MAVNEQMQRDQYWMSYRHVFNCRYPILVCLRCLLLSWIHNNPIQIRTLGVESIPEPANRDLVLLPLCKGQLERSGEDCALVRIPLVEGLHVLGVAIDNDAADATKLPCASNAVGGSTSCES